MANIQQELKRLAVTGDKTYSADEIERLKRKVMARNSICSPDCEICAGIGFVKGEDGKVRPCPNVDPYTLYPGERYGLYDSERGLSWGDVMPINERDTTAAVNAVKQAMARGAGWVYLWGETGTAKTLLLKIAVALSLKDHKIAAYVRMAGILDDLRSAFDKTNPSGEAQRRLDWWSDIPVLAVDEFNRIKESEYAIERRFLLMDRRYEDALRGRSITLMAGNDNPASLESYLYDRIRDGRFAIVHLSGDSARPGMEW